MYMAIEASEHDPAARRCTRHFVGSLCCREWVKEKSIEWAQKWPPPCTANGGHFSEGVTFKMIILQLGERISRRAHFSARDVMFCARSVTSADILVNYGQ